MVMNNVLKTKLKEKKDNNKKEIEDQPSRMTVDENRLARQMPFDQGFTPTKVAEALSCSLSAV